MAGLRAGRRLVLLPVACFILAACAALTATTGFVGLNSYALERGLGLTDSVAALVIAVPFGGLSFIAFRAAKGGQRLRRGNRAAPALSAIRLLITLGFAPLLIGMLTTAAALGFLDIVGSSWVPTVAVMLTRWGVLASLLGWLAAMVIAWTAPDQLRTESRSEDL
jgi:hypothetical protein